MSNRTGKARGGFTLIEILIVLAIIGILAAILLPVFASVRDTARTATCASNLRQISLGLRLYLDSNDRRYPPVFGTTSMINCSWADVILPYARSTEIFNCPSDPLEETEFRAGCPGSGSLEEAIRFNGSYGLNELRVEGVQGTSERRIRRPSSTILVTEYGHSIGGILSPYTIADGLRRSYRTPENIAQMGVPVPGWHREGANVLFADGRVERLSIEEMCRDEMWMLDKQ